MKPTHYIVYNTIDNTRLGKVPVKDSSGKIRSSLEAKKIACKRIFPELPEEMVLPYLITTF